MELAGLISDRDRFSKAFQWLIVAIGVVVFLFAARNLSVAELNFQFLVIAAMTVIVSSRVAVKIPRFNTSVTISDTFVFLALLVYGGAAAILLAFAEGLIAGAHAGRKARTILFGGASMGCSTAITAVVLKLAFGNPQLLIHGAFQNLAAALCVIALTQYFANTGVVALCMALKHQQSFWQMWSRTYLWSFITYFAGAVGAGFIASRVDMIGLYLVLVAMPTIFILYFTYQKYLEDVRTNAAKAEQAERARADAERARAEQAECHVEELNHYIAELERTSRALQESKEHFRHAAFHDSLTDLPNRGLFSDYLRLAMERCKRQSDYVFAVLFLDLDRFKYINDSLGHSCGDQLIVELARRLQSCLRQVDTVARFGGDEFAILLDGIKDANDAVRVAEKIQQELQKPFLLGGHEAYTSASIGIAMSSAGYEEADYSATQIRRCIARRTPARPCYNCLTWKCIPAR